MINKVRKTFILTGIGDIENWRLNLRNKYFNIQTLKPPVPNILIQDYVSNHSFTIWKTLTYLKKIFLYKEQLEKDEKEQIIHQIDCLFIDLGLGKGFFDFTILENYQRNLQSMYKLISSLDIFEKDTERVKRIQDNLDYLKGKTEILIDFNEKIDFKKIRRQRNKK